MTVKELQYLKESLIDLWDFSSNSLDGDESGLGEEMSKHYEKSLKIVKKEQRKLYERNFKARVKLILKRSE